ncbi:MAG: tetratricopeptide repeat protein [Candidatus Magnetomorum sp.]|nr:tetratricopeptide repeat protein [Candidatus Magnetomorum sp.]
MKKSLLMILICILWACASQDLRSQSSESLSSPQPPSKDTRPLNSTAGNATSTGEPVEKKSYKTIDDAYSAMKKNLSELPEESVKSAFELAVKTLKDHPNHVIANIVLFEAHLYKKNEEQVVELFNKLVRLTPETPELCIELGAVIAKLGKISEAMIQFQRSVELDPNYATGYYNLGRAYFMKRDFEQAIIAYKKTVELNPREHRAWNNLGWVYMAQKDFEHSMTSLKRAIQEKQDYPVAYLNLGMVYLLQKDLDNAEGMFKQYIELKPDDSEGYRNLSSVYQQKGKMDDAIQILRTFLQIKPDDIIAKNNLAVLLLSKARYGESVRLLKSIHNKNVNDPKFNKEVAKTLAVASYHLAEALTKREGKSKQAIDAYRDYLNLSDNLSEDLIKEIEMKIKRLENTI